MCPVNLEAFKLIFGFCLTPLTSPLWATRHPFKTFVVVVQNPGSKMLLIFNADFANGLLEYSLGYVSLMTMGMTLLLSIPVSLTGSLVQDSVKSQRIGDQIPNSNVLALDL
jgi:hypothetical protein